MVNILDLRWVRYVDTLTLMELVSLTTFRMHRHPVGPIAFFNQKSPSPRRQ
jgi:hypothetical protein